ncbi:class I SAM-dependent methyltransferase [Desulfotalea psychrophila]|uniref:Ribosomal RNA small subunit methyltransferase J n=1 Tax=Desulfotalea psychrophila (strain LSv54 / DSM 12343) TaxID=177439 RepID=RSMJ_DESPS|nr:class I SAM-dependent methyltransferase [Desulfotalea psychrophila]Q6AL31.1 RecName: Full=Ribosomal RNA small subunit methyltransferase J; AltName: Full=16S rRNA m2G1516 methyltransferase; AltName: Full=rRNA (guanine-N(2)-)-methyltransferase [Desulfotalea psychrophila LSv54]CAG36944.1 conserved hypothetical protein [Desulfotalea psychrophila LSv54]
MLHNITLSLVPEIITDNILIKAKEIAQFLNIPLSDRREEYPQALIWDRDGLSLCSISAKDGSHAKLLYIDFMGGKNGYRHANDCTTRQPIAKAVGIKPGFRPTVFDATAGMGGDGFVLACLGCRVTLCERSPIMYTLLQDGIERARQDSVMNKIMANLDLIHNNSKQFLENHGTNYHTIYMDPMYPHKKKSALNKKEMRVIRDLVGDDNDSDNLLETALTVAGNRVVVKRPKGAPYIEERKPHHEITMKNSRFDVYLTSYL